ncbi:MAG: hypothetical protein MJ150_02680 [Clostridia bacterium]|nr:hypothetical protein [Clostridia bacterium]
MKRLLQIILCVVLVFSFTGCRKGNQQDNNPVSQKEQMQETTGADDNIEGDTPMKMYIGETEIPVIWENNNTVSELKNEAAKSDIIVSMSMYSDNEQVGSLGKSYTRSDKQTTTHNGDIVLYNGNNIVVFYGSNTWSYTRLGKMNLPEKEVTKLLSNGNVTLKITLK